MIAIVTSSSMSVKDLFMERQQLPYGFEADNIPRKAGFFKAEAGRGGRRRHFSRRSRFFGAVLRRMLRAAPVFSGGET